MIKKKVQYLVRKYEDGEEVERFKSHNMRDLMTKYTIDKGYFVVVLAPSFSRAVLNLAIDFVNLIIARISKE